MLVSQCSSHGKPLVRMHHQQPYQSAVFSTLCLAQLQATSLRRSAALLSVQSAFLSMYKLRNIDPARAVGFKNIGNCFKDPSRMRCNMIDCVHTSDKSISLQIGTHTEASQVVWYDIMRSTFKHDRQFSQAGVPIMMVNSTSCILLSK